METAENKPPLKPEDFPSMKPEDIAVINAAAEAQKAAPAPAFKEPTPEEVKAAALARQKADAIAFAAELNAKTEGRVKELKTYEGKTFRRKLANEFKNQTFTVVRYEGIFPIQQTGQLAHYFRIEAKTPGSIFLAVARDFLNDFEEIEVQTETKSNEVI